MAYFILLIEQKKHPKWILPIVAAVNLLFAIITFGTAMGTYVSCFSGVCFNSGPPVAYAVIMVVGAIMMLIFSCIGGFIKLVTGLMGFFALVAWFFYNFFLGLLIGWNTAVIFSSGGANPHPVGASLAFGLLGMLVGFIYIYLSVGTHIFDKEEAEGEAK